MRALQPTGVQGECGKDEFGASHLVEDLGRRRVCATVHNEKEIGMALLGHQDPLRGMVAHQRVLGLSGLLGMVEDGIVRQAFRAGIHDVIKAFAQLNAQFAVQRPA